MRANCWPTVKEVSDPLRAEGVRIDSDEMRAAIRDGVRVLELLLKCPIRPLRVEANVLLGDDSYILPDFPTHDLTIDGRAPEPQFCEWYPDIGLLKPRLPRKTYEVVYRVGYVDGELPALFQVLVEQLARLSVVPEQVDRDGVIALLQTAQRTRAEELEERRASIGGEGARQGPSGHSTRRYPLE